MDPFGQHEDYEVWEALRQCGLAGRTPGASANTSRAASRATSRAVSRSASAHDLSAGDDDGITDTSGGERMAIRSLDEQVAVGGKNFSACAISSLFFRVLIQVLRIATEI